jgi:hypothetical protein
MPAPVMHFYSGSPMHFLSGVDTSESFLRVVSKPSPIASPVRQK